MFSIRKLVWVILAVMALAGPASAQTIDVSVASSAADADETAADAVNITNTSANPDDANEWIFMKFNGITIPAGATVTVAYLSLHFPNSNADEPEHTFFVEDTNTPADAVASSNNLDSRDMSEASVTWSNTGLGTMAATYDTPSMVTLIQERISDSGGSLSGANIAFLARSTNGTNTRDMEIALFDHLTAPAPALHIEYTTAGSGGSSLLLVGVGK